MYVSSKVFEQKWQCTCGAVNTLLNNRCVGCEELRDAWTCSCGVINICARDRCACGAEKK